MLFAKLPQPRLFTDGVEDTIWREEFPDWHREERFPERSATKAPGSTSFRRVSLRFRGSTLRCFYPLETLPGPDLKILAAPDCG